MKNLLVLGLLVGGLVSAAPYRQDQATIAAGMGKACLDRNADALEGSIQGMSELVRGGGPITADTQNKLCFEAAQIRALFGNFEIRERLINRESEDFDAFARASNDFSSSLEYFVRDGQCNLGGVQRSIVQEKFEGLIRNYRRMKTLLERHDRAVIPHPPQSSPFAH